MTKPSFVFVKWMFVGVLGLLLFYFLLSSLISRSFVHSIDQFVLLQPWISILTLTFGVQVGLYKAISIHSRALSATGTVNGVSMIACCAHHVTDVIPILGVGGLSLFLTQYQKDFLILGVVVNLFAIFYFLKFLSFEKVKLFRYVFLSIAAPIIFLGLYSMISSAFVRIPYEPQIKQVGVIEVEVTPKEMARGKPVVFELKLNNHSIDLNYDFMELAVLVDDEGNIYKPVSWDGSVGGHHVLGDLTFPKLSSVAKHIGLNVVGIGDQTVNFDWEL